jgi:hypothetical protein
MHKPPSNKRVHDHLQNTPKHMAATNKLQNAIAEGISAEDTVCVTFSRWLIVRLLPTHNALISPSSIASECKIVSHSGGSEKNIGRIER